MYKFWNKLKDKSEIIIGRIINNNETGSFINSEYKFSF